MSAIGFEQGGALLELLPVQDVKTRILDLLREVRVGVLNDIAQGDIPGTGVTLHRMPQSLVTEDSSFVTLKDITPMPITFPQPSSISYFSNASTPVPSTPQVQINSPLRHALSTSRASTNHLIQDQVILISFSSITSSLTSLAHVQVNMASLRLSRSALANSPSSPNPMRPPVRPTHLAPSITNKQASTSGGVSTLMSGHTFTYGRPAPHEFREGQQWSTFFGDLREPQCNWPVGMVQGVRSRKVNDVLAGVFLAQSSPQSTLPPDITIVPGPTTRRDTSGMAIAEFTQHLLEIKDLFERQKALLSGSDPDHPLKLNWLKDTIDLEEDWLLPSVDIDSLSLTTSNPQFMEPVVIHAYPPRAATISTDNGLKVLHNGQERPLSHSNNQRYKMFMKNMDYRWWYDEVFLVMLEKVSNRLPPNLMPAYVQATQELPAMYFVAEKRAVSASKGGRNFTGHKMIPELLNHILPIMREIVERKDDLAHFHGFFFHIYGINLKMVGQGLDSCEQGNLLRHIFNTYPIVDWDKQNPQDVVVDFGLEININPRHLPADINHVTLLWDFDNVSAILRDTWALPRMDSYMHSHVIAGLRSWPLARGKSTGLIKFQCYHKDSKQTYVHGDRSIGTGFSPEDAMSASSRFHQEMSRLAGVWKPLSSFGVRAEWRCTAWPIAILQQQDPQVWLQTLLSRGAIVGHHTRDIRDLKMLFKSCYQGILARQQRLARETRTSDGPLLLTSVLSYLIKGLVSRPDDMSSTRHMVKRLGIVDRAFAYGFASIQPNAISPDLTQVDDLEVEPEDFPILRYVKRKAPSGARLKTSRACPDERAPTPQAEPPDTESPETTTVWTRHDEDWLQELLNHDLARWLWNQFPVQHRRPDLPAKLLQGPLLFSTWQQVVIPAVPHQERSRRANFKGAVSTLFPQNWTILEKGAQWAGYREVVLQPIRRRIDRQPNPGQYSAKVRAAIDRILGTWHFLPSLQKRYVWPYEGTGFNRIYMLVANPDVLERP
ncbi:Cell wall alpha-1,3-glucan synthase ags1 [Ceratobasidium theobromae]|uniref:Cell wall alpha-1,3-glucan synthase ags1 n=1 Tax=Ceratobasidium theobromae TaxID=1582974 RepID=A0A5N5Q941_9AGAM|nr:Cell wall alpha-1,3-glucan synthase ags1 [Ceratobasidium theobromae]